jgi:stearoyl-CoA desaturase (delta-9 desaturase)
MKSLTDVSRSYYLKFNLPLQILFLILLPFVSIDLFYFLIFYILIYWIGIQAGFHKLFSHKSWEPKNKFIKYSLAVIGCFGLMGGPITWARIHRYHHAHSDTNFDPHSPSKGFYVSYFGWLLKPMDVPVFVIRDYLKDNLLIKIEKLCRQIVLVSLLIVFFISPAIGMSLLAAMILTFHSEMLINSLLHKKVDGEYTAINITSLALLSGGSTLHKNHHINPSNANLKNKWTEVDLSYQIIRVLKK